MSSATRSLSRCCCAVLAASCLCAEQNYADAATTAVSIQNLDTTVKLDPRKTWQAELDLENRTQGIPGTWGPFAAEQQQRATIWLHYAPTASLRLSAGYASISRNEIPQVEARGYHENRYSVRARLTQGTQRIERYEELWLQIRAFPDSSGTPLTFPGVRLRYGQQYTVGGGTAHSIDAYGEVLFQFAPASYTAARFSHVRLNATYLFPVDSDTSFEAGMRIQEALQPSGTYNFTYGPVFSFDYRP